MGEMGAAAGLRAASSRSRSESTKTDFGFRFALISLD
jgi:hypothetical protein